MPQPDAVDLSGGMASVEGEVSGVRVASDGRSLERTDGSPFFYLADTAWTALTRLTLAEMDAYLADRASKGFTVIQTILVPWDAAWAGDVDGAKPFIEGDETRPNEVYWARVDAWLGMIKARGMVPAVVPFWLRGRNGDLGPVAGDLESMAGYAAFLGQRYARHELIWLLGADALGDSWTEHLARFAEELERASARVVSSEPGATPREPWLMTHHPEGGGTSARLFHDQAWLDFNGLQSGHWTAGHHDALVDHAWRVEPVKPVIDLEPAYEHITDGLAEFGPGVRLVGEADVRRQAYQAVFAGAAGHAYGCAEVYEFHAENVGKARWTVGTHWREAMQFPGAGQLRHLRALMEQLPMKGRVPDQSLIGGSATDDVTERRRAIRNASGDRVLVYLPQGGRVNLSYVTAVTRPAAEVREVVSAGWLTMWFDPRSGDRTPCGRWTLNGDGELAVDVTSPTSGAGQDWVLILEQSTEE